MSNVLEASGGERVEVAWTALRDRWADEEQHRRFLELCAQSGRLGDAARLYRQVLAETPDDAPAKAGLDQALRRAMQALTVSAEERNSQWIEGARRTWIGLLIVLAVAVLVGFGIFWIWRVG